LSAPIAGTILSEGFLGLDTLENDVYATPEVVKKVHDLGLLFACYGDDVGENLARMRDLSVDVAIFDRFVTCCALFGRTFSKFAIACGAGGLDNFTPDPNKTNFVDLVACAESVAWILP